MQSEGIMSLETSVVSEVVGSADGCSEPRQTNQVNFPWARSPRTVRRWRAREAHP